MPVSQSSSYSKLQSMNRAIRPSSAQEAKCSYKHITLIAGHLMSVAHHKRVCLGNHLILWIAYKCDAFKGGHTVKQGTCKQMS